MKRKLIPLIIGNWKMNPSTEKEAVALLQGVIRATSGVPICGVGVAVPSLYIAPLAKKVIGKNVLFGVQNVSAEPSGAHTGDVSLPMFEKYHVTFSLVGHSERRAQGETDAQVALKVSAVLAAGMTAVLCVGERVRDEDGVFLTMIEEQVVQALTGVTASMLAHVVIAYEPVWAIGTGCVATPHDAYAMKLFIQKVLSDMYGERVMRSVRILYGGSVNAENIYELVSDAKVDGFLVGSASLNSKAFAKIIKTVHAENNHV